LGRGSYATVKLVKDTTSGNLFAMKTMSKDFLKRQRVGVDSNAYEYVKGELKVLQRLEHPNIIYLHEIIDDPSKDSIHVITQYHSKGSLADRLEKRNEKFALANLKYQRSGRTQLCHFQGINSSEARLYFIDMLKALHYCHTVIKVIHRDIKPENIMLNHNNEAVLIDFGVCCTAPSSAASRKKQHHRNMGTLMFYSPEMLNPPKDEAGEHIEIDGRLHDIWALGVSFYWLLTGKYPFGQHISVLNLKAAIIKKEVDFSLILNQQA